MEMRLDTQDRNWDHSMEGPVVPRVAMEGPPAQDPLFSSLTGLQSGHISSRNESVRAWVLDDLGEGKLQRESSEWALRAPEGGLWLTQQCVPQFHSKEVSPMLPNSLAG